MNVINRYRSTSLIVVAFLVLLSRQGKIEATGCGGLSCQSNGEDMKRFLVRLGGHENNISTKRNQLHDYRTKFEVSTEFDEDEIYFTGLSYRYDYQDTIRTHLRVPKSSSGLKSSRRSGRDSEEFFKSARGRKSSDHGMERSETNEGYHGKKSKHLGKKSKHKGYDGKKGAEGAKGKKSGEYNGKKSIEGVRGRKSSDHGMERSEKSEGYHGKKSKHLGKKSKHKGYYGKKGAEGAKGKKSGEYNGKRSIEGVRGKKESKKSEEYHGKRSTERVRGKRISKESDTYNFKKGSQGKREKEGEREKNEDKRNRMKDKTSNEEKEEREKKKNKSKREKDNKSDDKKEEREKEKKKSKKEKYNKLNDKNIEKEKKEDKRNEMKDNKSYDEKKEREEKKDKRNKKEDKTAGSKQKQAHKSKKSSSMGNNKNIISKLIRETQSKPSIYECGLMSGNRIKVEVDFQMETNTIDYIPVMHQMRVDILEEVASAVLSCVSPNRKELRKLKSTEGVHYLESNADSYKMIDVCNNQTTAGMYCYLITGVIIVRSEGQQQSMNNIINAIEVSMKDDIFMTKNMVRATYIGSRESVLARDPSLEIYQISENNNIASGIFIIPAVTSIVILIALFLLKRNKINNSLESGQTNDSEEKNLRKARIKEVNTFSDNDYSGEAFEAIIETDDEIICNYYQEKSGQQHKFM